MVTTRRPIYKQSAASATKDWTRGTSLRTAQADATPEYVEVEEQDEHIVMIYVDGIYAISPLGGATYLVKLFAKHGLSLDPKPVINDGVTKTYFLGTEITQSADRFEVTIGMQGFIEGMVHDLASDTANFVNGWDSTDETKQMWKIVVPLLYP